MMTLRIDLASEMVHQLLRSIFLTFCVLPLCPHNPTGFDPPIEQWSLIVELLKRKGLYAFLEFAYQGFASGDPIEAAWAVRLFFQADIEFCVRQTFPQKFGLYRHCAGALQIVPKRSYLGHDLILAKLCGIIRQEFSIVPGHRSAIVETVLENESGEGEWEENLKTMPGRIKSMRNVLFEKLTRLETPGS